jgi:hypothetical protein
VHGSLFDLLHESDFFIRDSAGGGRMSMASIYGIENSLASRLHEDEDEDEEAGRGDGDRGSDSSQSSLLIDNSTPFDDEERGDLDLEAGLRSESHLTVVTNLEEESEFGSYNFDLINGKGDRAARSQSSHTNSTESRGHSLNYDSSFGTYNSSVQGSQSSSRRIAHSQVNVVLNAESGEVSELGEDLIRKLQRSSSKSVHALTMSNVENLKSAASVMQSKRMGYGLGPTNSKTTPLASQSSRASR